jgi:bifunctional UDP-N-acetylglucosamine pyrophosphorylase/glucosamine-1-phosphate N-acetyltransferase
LLAIQEVNTGIMAVNAELLKKWLSEISNDHAQQEYYLTDIIALANKDNAPIVAAHPDSAVEVEGANDRVQLANLEREYQRRAAEVLMRDGATLMDPSRIDIRGTVTVGTDVVIDANVIFEGEVHLGSGVHIEANCILRNCRIGADTLLRSHTLVEESVVGERCTLGPFARLRPNSEMKNNSHVGNFVEMKKSTLGEGSKANHLSYIGDSEVGQKVNIGAGTITCNYDGANKHKTIIKDGAFIGSNSSLVAPVIVGENTTVGAGSTVSKEIEDNVLVVVRGKAVKKTGWKRPVKKAKD